MKIKVTKISFYARLYEVAHELEEWLNYIGAEKILQVIPYSRFNDDHIYLVITREDE